MYGSVPIVQPPMMQPQLQFNQFAHNQFLQIISTLLLNARPPVPPQVQNVITQNLSLSNPAAQPMIAALHGWIRHHYPPNQINADGSLNQQTLTNILAGWLQNAIGQVMQQLSMQAQPAWGMPMPAQAMGIAMPALGVGQAMTYDTAPAAPARQIHPPPPAPPAPPAPTLPTQPTRSPTPMQTAAVPTAPALLTPTTLDWRPVPTDDLLIPPQLTLKTVYRGSDTGQATRMSCGVLQYHPAENRAYDVFRTAMALLPSELQRGLWFYLVEYRQLTHLPINTETYLNFQTAAREAYKTNNGGWRAAIERLQDVTNTHEWKVISGAMSARINEQMVRRIRFAANDDYSVGIDDLEDLIKLFDPHCKLQAAQHTNFGTILARITNRVFHDFIVDDTVVKPGKPNKEGGGHFGDFIHCDAVQFWDKTSHISKYDIGFLVSQDQERAAAELTARSTVLRHRRAFGFTNALPDLFYKQIAGLAPAVVGAERQEMLEHSSDQLGLFDSAYQHLLGAETDTLDLADDFFVLQPQLTAHEYLMTLRHNRTLDGRLFTTATRRTIGW